MPSPKIVIVGGVAAGASAAAKARRCSEEAEIILYEKGDAISYANCGLPYFVGGVIRDRNHLLISDPVFFRERFNVEAKTRHEVVDVDAKGKTITVVDLDASATFVQPYDKLILATGADALRPPLEGVDLPFVFTLKTLADTDRVHRYLQTNDVREAVIVGGGLIGIEMVENFAARGIKVTVVEFLPQILSFLDEEMAAVATRHMEEKGVSFLFGEKVISVRRNDSGNTVETASGKSLAADMVILSVGIRPNTKLALKAGLAIGETGGIKVDACMRTSDPDIYAAGDCIESLHLVTGKPVLVPMGSAANKEGRAAGANSLGRQIQVKGFCGTVIVKAFDLAVGKTGLSEREAVKEGFVPVVTYVLAGHHAGYYPGAREVRLKVVTDGAGGRLLGAQAIGAEGVDKRIDVFATALYNRMRTEELVDLDLAYAPPYSSARDPVIVSGMLQQNIAAGDLRPVTPAALREELARGERLTLVDVRTRGELRRLGHLPGALHIPIDALRERLHELDPSDNIVLYCAVGLRSYLGSRILAMHGFDKVRTLTGGFSAWNYPVSRD